MRPLPVIICLLMVTLAACDVTVDDAKYEAARHDSVTVSKSRTVTVTTVPSSAIPAAPAPSDIKLGPVECRVELPDGWVRQTATSGEPGTTTYVNVSLPMSLNVRCEQLTAGQSEVAYLRFRRATLDQGEEAGYIEKYEDRRTVDGVQDFRFTARFPVDDGLLVRNTSLRISGGDYRTMVIVTGDLLPRRPDLVETFTDFADLISVLP